MTRYFTNSTDKVICEIRLSNNLRYIGIAKCSPADKFNYETGKQIAYARALRKFKKSEQNFWKKQLENLQYYYDCYVNAKRRLEYTNNKLKSIDFDLLALTASTSDDIKF